MQNSDLSDITQNKVTIRKKVQVKVLFQNLRQEGNIPAEMISNNSVTKTQDATKYNN